MNQRLAVIRKASATDFPVDYTAKKRKTILLLIAYAAIVGIIVCFLPEEDSPLDLVFGIPFLLLGISWCFTDACERRHEIGKLTKLLLVFLFVVGFPLYVIQSRGIRGISTLGLTILLVSGLCACMLLTSLATLYAGEAVGAWEITGWATPHGGRPSA